MHMVFNWIGRARWLPVVLLVLCVLAPYNRMVTGRAVPIPDDIFVSDLADGEFPACVEAGRLVRAGEAPVWTPRILTGMPLMVNPLTMPLFAGLPPAMALGLFIGLLLAVAAVGGYLLARECGASRAGGFLSGFAFAWSGFFVCQLRHLGVLGVVAFFPLALFCLERAATGGARDRAGARAMPSRRRLAWLTGFAALFGIQGLSGFPQSLYIAALVYGALVTVRLLWLLTPDERGQTWALRLPPAITLAWGALAAVAIGTMISMVVLLPLHELGSLSDRSSSGSYEWATHYNYWPRNFLTFFTPYINGDISNGTYQGKSIFWEDYGYVGLVTMLLAILVAVVRVRRFAVAFWALVALVAYGLVLGREAPFYRIAFQVLPGFDAFRFPSRFLFVVELALAMLGGLGLTLVQDFLARRAHPARMWTRWLPGLVGACLAAAVAGDLVWHNRRQNPMVDRETWLTPPHSARLIQQDGSGGRIFTPGSATFHMAAFHAARGWSGDLSPYVRQREFLQPNSNLLHGLDTLDGYAGIAPRWSVSLFGDHNRAGLFNLLYGFDTNGLRVAPVFFDWLEATSVRWIILTVRVASQRLQHVGSAPPVEVYRLRHALPRVRLVTRASLVHDHDDLSRLVAEGTFDPRREVALFDTAVDVVAALNSTGPADAAPGEACIVKERNTEIVIEARTASTALLLLADTYYPGWHATVDGRPVPILQANLAHRAVLLTPGTHRVVFAYRPTSVIRGLFLTGLGLLLLLTSSLSVLGLWRHKSSADQAASCATRG